MNAPAPIQDPALSNSHELLRSWCNIWGVSELAAEISVEFSSRMTRSLGRCYPDRKLIRIAEFVVEESQELFRKVLCHEVAHLAAYELHGNSIRPHGREWKVLMQQAGYSPSVKFTGDCSFPTRPTRPSRPRLRYEHRCPVCQATRFARRPMHGWRCARCVKSGLVGQLEIRTWPIAKEAAR
jgi:predicted SprT family Zn-dependent metalloprotease